MTTIITQPSAAALQVGQAVASGGSYAVLAATGGTAPYTWQLCAGVLPPGLNFDPTGRITGSPEGSGSALLLVRATDSTGQFSDAWLSVTA